MLAQHEVEGPKVQSDQKIFSQIVWNLLTVAKIIGIQGTNISIGCWMENDDNLVCMVKIKSIDYETQKVTQKDQGLDNYQKVIFELSD